VTVTSDNVDRDTETAVRDIVSTKDDDIRMTASDVVLANDDEALLGLKTTVDDGVKDENEGMKVDNSAVVEVVEKGVVEASAENRLVVSTGDDIETELDRNTMLELCVNTLVVSRITEEIIELSVVKEDDTLKTLVSTDGTVEDTGNDSERDGVTTDDVKLKSGVVKTEGVTSVGDGVGVVEIRTELVNTPTDKLELLMTAEDVDIVSMLVKGVVERDVNTEDVGITLADDDKKAVVKGTVENRDVNSTDEDRTAALVNNEVGTALDTEGKLVVPADRAVDSTDVTNEVETVFTIKMEGVSKFVVLDGESDDTVDIVFMEKIVEESLLETKETLDVFSVENEEFTAGEVTGVVWTEEVK
jgi:hypothetical protein